MENRFFRATEGALIGHSEIKNRDKGVGSYGIVEDSKTLSVSNPFFSVVTCGEPYSEVRYHPVSQSKGPLFFFLSFFFHLNPEHTPCGGSFC